MTGFDEISRAIGRIEGKVEGLCADSKAQWEKLDSIENNLTNHRLKVAVLAGGISIFVSTIYHFFRSNQH